MNKEDMILEMLAAMRSEMDARFTKLEAAQTEMQTAQAEMQAAQAEMQETLTRVAVTQEGRVLPQIQLLFEGHSELNRKLDTLATKEQVEELSGEVDVIKAVVSRHSGDISRLRKAL